MRQSFLPRFMALTLAVLLAVTSVTVAVARGHAPGQRDVVICTTQGSQTITLDAQGKPVTYRHPCPDCVQSFGAALPVLAQIATPVAPLNAPTVWPQTLSVIPRTIAAALARAPPALT